MTSTPGKGPAPAGRAWYALISAPSKPVNVMFPALRASSGAGTTVSFSLRSVALRCVPLGGPVGASPTLWPVAEARGSGNRHDVACADRPWPSPGSCSSPPLW